MSLFHSLFTAQTSDFCIWLATAREQKADSLPDPTRDTDPDDEPLDHPRWDGPMVNPLTIRVCLPSKKELYRRALGLLTDKVLQKPGLGPRNLILGMGTKTRLLKKLGDEEGYEAS